MSKGLEALKYLDEHNLNWHDNPTKRYVAIIEKELKDKEKIEAKLSLIEMKIKARREEDCDTMSDTDEDSWLHERCEAELPLLDWFRDLLKEVLL